MNTAEMLTAFTGWLTTRPKPIVFGAQHNAGAPAEIVGKFIAANKLTPIRPNWGKIGDGIKDAIVPDNTDHITNWPDPVNQQATASVAPSAAEVAGRSLDMILSLNDEEQNIALAAIMKRLKRNRELSLADATNRIISARDYEQRAEQGLRDLDNIGHGSFSIFKG